MGQNPREWRDFLMIHVRPRGSDQAAHPEGSLQNRNEMMRQGAYDDTYFAENEHRLRSYDHILFVGTIQEFQEVWQAFYGMVSLARIIIRDVRNALAELNQAHGLLNRR